MAKQKLIFRGKTKSIYESQVANAVILRFRDDASAFGGAKRAVFEGKGVLNNRLSEHFMASLAQVGLPTHFLRRMNMRDQLVVLAEMIPLKVAVRNCAAGSMAARLGIEEGKVLPNPIVEFALKDEKLGYPAVTEEHAVAFGWASQIEMEDMTAMALRANDFLAGMMAGAGMRLVEVVLEFGRVWQSEFSHLVIADEISPDVCRLWDIKSGRKLDKDLFRNGDGDLTDGYSEVALRLGVLPKTGTRVQKPKLVN
ncbi:MAG: phosphoribosylaminoimidazolesuccinocarboxamide synthase [Albidovulum sp.]|nr:phosphoribosylaminoimidazolesuccinocarboxamide synthase [Albidovulum sp.]MDE0532380.1 phosphoribosylaminoimidazolesuccinocarboxamide synthase [Albidovulum sp.]